MIAFVCTGCGQKLNVKDEFAGKSAKCPKCGKVSVVPTPASQPMGNVVKPAAVPPPVRPAPPAAVPMPVRATPPAAIPVSAALPAAVPMPVRATPPAAIPVSAAPSAAVPAPPAVPFEATLPPSQESEGTGLGDEAASSADGSAADDLDFLAPAQAPDEIGRLGPYRILKKLGAGGMGVVLQAEDPNLQRQVALKVMKPSLATSDSAKKRFLREARAAASIKHDHIITIHQVGEERGIPFLAMEFLTGESLDERIKRDKKLPIPDALRIGREIAEGLAAAHDQGLIHRDIKPGNIWLESRSPVSRDAKSSQRSASPVSRDAKSSQRSADFRVKILDFGLARAARDDTHLTKSGAIVGTPQYMAPEQASSEVVDFRCDLFSLGCVLYRLCTGELPFKGRDTMGILLSLAQDTPKPPRKINSEAPQALSDLIEKLLEKKRENRPQSALEVADALRSIESDPTVNLPAALKVRKRPRKAVLIAGAVLGSIFLLAILLFARGKPGNVKTDPRGANKQDVAAKDQANAARPDDPSDAPPGNRFQPIAPRSNAPKWDHKLTPAQKAARSKLAVTEEWLKSVTAMKGEEQIKLLSTKLRELNLGFNGTVKEKIEKGVVVELQFFTRYVSDISPVRALTGLKKLSCKSDAPGCNVLLDLSPVAGLPLKEIECDFMPWYSREILQSIKTLEKINGKPVKEFWKGVDEELAAFEKWRKEVAKHAPDVQASMVGTKLKELPPGMTELVQYKIDNGEVTELKISSQKVMNISPVRALAGLQKLEFVTHHQCNHYSFWDLAPLSGMPLTDLNCNGTSITDLAPLKGMQLKRLQCRWSHVSDLTPLQGMPLAFLDCRSTKLIDLSPLRGMPLVYLDCRESKVADLAPLKGLPIEELWCDYQPERDYEILLAMKSLKKINNQAAADFLKKNLPTKKKK